MTSIGASFSLDYDSRNQTIEPPTWHNLPPPFTPCPTWRPASWPPTPFWGWSVRRNCPWRHRRAARHRGRRPTIGGGEVVNVCLHTPAVKDYERASLDRLLNRINTSIAAANRHAFLIFYEGREEMVTRLYSRLRSRNPVPSKYEVWEDGERTRDISIETVIGGPAFRSSHAEFLLQMVDLIAHALLKQEERRHPVSNARALLGPSASSTASSTAGRPGETPRASSGDEASSSLHSRIGTGIPNDATPFRCNLGFNYPKTIPQL